MSHNPDKISVILADDHAVVRAGIRQILEHGGDIQVVAEAENGHAAEALIQELKPDVAVLDIQMPKASGIEVTRWVRTHLSGVGVLILTAFDDDPYVVAALQAGANGYMLKTAEPEDLIRAVRDVFAGNTDHGLENSRLAGRGPLVAAAAGSTLETRQVVCEQK